MSRAPAGGARAAGSGSMLVLFDVDGTLLLSSGAGLRAMVTAGQDLFGAAYTVDGVDFAGNLDPIIFRQAAERSGLPWSAAAETAMRAQYGLRLAEVLQEPGIVRPLPGVTALLDALAADAGVTIGLLTGNYPETGRLKLRAAGLDPDRFPVAVYGDDGAVRQDLPPVGMGRYRAHAGRAIAPQDVIIIGDTPNDIACARAHGCRALAVATGPRHDLETLARCGPDHLVSDLSETASVHRWLRAGAVVTEAPSA